MRNAITIAATLIVAGAGMLVHAQDRSAPSAVSTVKDVLEKARDDDRVTVRGRIVRKLDDERYTLADATGEIRIEVDDDTGAERLPLDAQVEVQGEVDREGNKAVEIDVERIARL
jgi:uncharacterized protein (TIGR00156 family)